MLWGWTMHVHKYSRLDWRRSRQTEMYILIMGLITQIQRALKFGGFRTSPHPQGSGVPAQFPKCPLEEQPWIVWWVHRLSSGSWSIVSVLSHLFNLSRHGFLNLERMLLKAVPINTASVIIWAGFLSCAQWQRPFHFHVPLTLFLVRFLPS